MMDQRHQRSAISMLIGAIAYLLALAGTSAVRAESIRLFGVIVLLLVVGLVLNLVPIGGTRRLSY